MQRKSMAMQLRFRKMRVWNIYESGKVKLFSNEPRNYTSRFLSLSFIHQKCQLCVITFKNKNKQSKRGIHSLTQCRRVYINLKKGETRWKILGFGSLFKNR